MMAGCIKSSGKNLCQRETLRPMLIGRLVRVFTGLALFLSVPFVPEFDLAWTGGTALVLGGATFVVAGVRANPGCEITALPNLLLPANRQLFCWCPIFSPLDRLERLLRERPSTSSGT